MLRRRTSIIVMSLSENKVFEALNQARTDPRSLIPYITKTLDKFVDNMSYEIIPHCNMVTREGKSAWMEAIAFLKQQQPLSPLASHKGLQMAAQLHANDLAANDMMGHYGSNKSSMTDRILLFCERDNGELGENVAQQIKHKSRSHELETVISLIIDDGVKSRGHRSSIFSSAFAYVGIGIAENDKYLVVLDYAQRNLPLKKNLTNDHTEQIKPKPKAKTPDTLEKQKHTHVIVDKHVDKKIQKPKINQVEKHAKHQSQGGEKKGVVGKSSSTKTVTINGKTVKTSTTVLKYSDGSEETIVEESTTSH